jgi:uncharacterized membrane protein
LGRALSRREASNRTAITTPSDRVAAESRIVSLAYLVWPVAIYDRIAPRAEASQWYRFHLRQALWFGNIAALVALAAFLWPLLLSFAFANPTAIIWLYVLAMLADVALFVLWLVLAIRYSRRASQGELFEIPWVARITGTKSQTP